MLSFLITLRRLALSMFEILKSKESRAILFLALSLIIGGTFFYIQVEGFSPLDAVYFCVMTLTTVGYGDLSPVTPFGKIFTMIYTLFGLGIMTLLISEIAKGYLAVKKKTK